MYHIYIYIYIINLSIYIYIEREIYKVRKSGHTGVCERDINCLLACCCLLVIMCCCVCPCYVLWLVSF